jgi:hypothetical protein
MTRNAGVKPPSPLEAVVLCTQLHDRAVHEAQELELAGRAVQAYRKRCVAAEAARLRALLTCNEVWYVEWTVEDHALDVAARELEAQLAAHALPSPSPTSMQLTPLPSSMADAATQSVAPPRDEKARLQPATARRWFGGRA